ncbi:hypothetical protein A2Y83_02750 [Candidatus Falkowbacteria bacterium RBG_13_39_14]|uniref:ECF transporter S component n=1 Tax=Candidatus Falkowbacteria bacterium RBG_13_39_14 TaxID=1797985 RepID=A0A1F5S1F0_9BACT|nr:MAG: hypothetical protein A2Y83_02750 [Candidatus Falkowbacteria bacterium RBG_13_39_14]
MKHTQQFITKKNLLFIVIFVIFGFIALQIPVTQVVGSKAKFTFYDAFAPVAGSFIGSIPGAIAVFLLQFLNFLFRGARVQDAGTIIRFFPMLFALLYFGNIKKEKLLILIPICAMIGFIAHPIGRTVWYFSLFWIIPILALYFRDILFVRALGAAFTAHAVGSALWIWFFPLPAQIWNSLIPVVIAERLLIAFGICGSFIFVNNFLGFLEKKHILKLGFCINQKYLAPSLRSE